MVATLILNVQVTNHRRTGWGGERVGLEPPPPPHQSQKVLKFFGKKYSGENILRGRQEARAGLFKACLR